MLPRILLRCPDTCETCRFWQPDEGFDDNSLGECRLKARAFNAVASSSAGSNALPGLPRRPWPLTESRDWCTEWRDGMAT